MGLNSRNIILGLLIPVLLGCEPNDPVSPGNSGSQEGYVSLEIPVGFPEPNIPEDNQLTESRILLGKMLFHDKALSVDSSISCASCHLQSHAFADSVAISPGVNGALGARNSPSLANLAWQENLFMEGGVPNLELQVLSPLADPHEMAFNSGPAAERLAENPVYADLSRKAYDREFDIYVITHAIASFERTLISANSSFDRYHFHGEENAMTESQKRGYSLFYSDSIGCGNCHSGPLLTDQDFHNIGLYEEYEDEGRARLTLKESDRGKFKTPSLRNVALTAPYMHDGSVGSLEEVIEHFNSGGVGHANQSGQIRPLHLNAQQKADLIAFLNSLTDKHFIENPDYSEQQ